MRVDAMTKSVSSKDATPGSTSAGAVPISVVIVTMDTHLASATERAYRRLLQDFPGLSLRLHAATEWGDDAAALARCRADIASGDRHELAELLVAVRTLRGLRKRRQARRLPRPAEK